MGMPSAEMVALPVAKWRGEAQKLFHIHVSCSLSSLKRGVI